jgi:hypothetical protein
MILAKMMTMVYGIHMEFFSELGKHHRLDEDDNVKPFDD